MITLDKEISHQFYSNSRNHPPTTIKGENEPFQLLLLLYFLVFPSLLLRSFHTQNILKGSVSLPNFCSVIPSPGLRLLLLLLSIRWYSNLYHTEQWPHCDTMKTTQSSVVRTAAHEIRNRVSAVSKKFPANPENVQQFASVMIIPIRQQEPPKTDVFH